MDICCYLQQVDGEVKAKGAGKAATVQRKNRMKDSEEVRKRRRTDESWMREG